MIKDTPKETPLLKIAYDISPQSVPNEALLKAVTRFLKGLVGDTFLAPIKNITSPDLGTSDLALINKVRNGLTIIRIQKGEDFPSFALRAAAYHSWLKDWLRTIEEALDRSMMLDMYLISHRVPAVDSYLLKVLYKITSLSVVNYQVLNIEEDQAPVVRFKLLNMGRYRKGEFNTKDNCIEAFSETIEEERIDSSQQLTPTEMDAFYRLQERYIK